MKILITLLAIFGFNVASAQGLSAPDFKTEDLENGKVIRFIVGDSHYDLPAKSPADLLDQVEQHLKNPQPEFLEILKAAKQKLRGQAVTLRSDLVEDRDETLKETWKRCLKAAHNSELKLAHRAHAFQDSWAFKKAIDAFATEESSKPKEQDKSVVSAPAPSAPPATPAPAPAAAPKAPTVLLTIPAGTKAQ
ncbi:MAG: hypothetical protein V4509_02790 [Patescibacteria group bacterium]